VLLVGNVELLEASAGQLAGHTCGALHLGRGIGARVHRSLGTPRVLPVFLRFGEVGAGDEFANEEHVGALDDFGLQRRQMNQGRLHARWAQVGEGSERSAQAQNRLLWSDRRPGIVPLRSADRAEQHRVAAFGHRDGLFSNSNSILINRRPADQVLSEPKLVRLARLDSPQHSDGFGPNLRPNTVTRQDSNTVCSHWDYDSSSCNINSDHLWPLYFLWNRFTIGKQALDIKFDSLSRPLDTFFDGFTLSYTSWQRWNCHGEAAFFQIRIENNCVFSHASTLLRASLGTLIQNYIRYP